MRLAARLTLDGIVRALRTRAHDIADAQKLRHSSKARQDAGLRPGRRETGAASMQRQEGTDGRSSA